MKKMMIVLAATALVGVASAGTCNDTACPFGYRLKVMVRTTTPCNARDAANACNDCATATYRTPAIRKFMGVVYGETASTAGKCGDVCGCNDWKDNAYVALYDYDTGRPVTLDASTTELIQLNRIGCKAEDRAKAELAFSIGTACGKNVAQMTFAGFGLCGNHNGEITLGAVAGYCAGQLPSGTIVGCGPCDDGTESCGSKVWNLCCNTAYDCNYTAAYGKWTLVWDGGIADRVGSNLTASQAKTAWGTATPVKLADKRACSDCECSGCSD